MKQLDRWRRVFTDQGPLLRDLVLIVVCCVVAGLYFNEQWSAHSQQQRQQAITSLANQLAAASYVPLAANNRVSLNVLAQQFDAAVFIQGVQIKHLNGSLVSSAGGRAAIKAEAAIGGNDQEIIGRVVVFGRPPAGLPYWPFVLIVLCLLGGRCAFSLCCEQLLPQSLQRWRALRQRLQGMTTVAAEGPPQAAPAPVPAPLVEARLAVRIVNYARLCERYTDAARDELVATYDALFTRVATAHGLEASRLNGNNLLMVKQASEAEALFVLAQFAEHFRLCCKLLDNKRRAVDDPCLAFSLLLHSAEAPLAKAGMLPFGLLLAAPSEWLAERVHYRPVEHWQEGGASWQLMAVDGLAIEFQQNVDAGAARLLEEA